MKALIADDEPVLRYHLQQLLGELWPELEIAATASNGEEAWQLTEAIKPDVLFLDIKMPVMTGLEVAKRIQDAGLSSECRVIFLTAFDEFAVEAFEREAIDYLLKPVDEKRLEQSIARIQQAQAQEAPQLIDVAQLESLIPRTQSPTLRWLNCQRGEDIFVIDIDDVLYFQAEDKYTTVVTHEGESIIRKSLKQLEEATDSDEFWRIHRSTLVQVKHIERVEKTLTGKYLVHIKGKKQALTVSRRFNERFKQM